MEKDQEQKKEGDSEGRAEEPETEPISDEFERRMRDLGEKMKIRFAKNRGHQGSSEHAKAESRTMKQDQIDLALEAWRQGASLQGIKEMIAIPGKTVDSFELWDVLLEKGALTKESLNTRGKYAKIQTEIGTKQRRR